MESKAVCKIRFEDEFPSVTFLRIANGAPACECLQCIPEKILVSGCRPKPCTNGELFYRVSKKVGTHLKYLFLSNSWTKFNKIWQIYGPRGQYFPCEISEQLLHLQKVTPIRNKHLNFGFVVAWKNRLFFGWSNLHKISIVQFAVTSTVHKYILLYS